MPKRRIFEATAPDGTIVRRTSDSKVYSHAVVHWAKAYPGNPTFPAREAGWELDRVQWCSRLDLAQKAAARWGKAVVLEARELVESNPAYEVGAPFRIVEQTRTLASPPAGLKSKWTEYQVRFRGKILSRHDLLDDAITDALARRDAHLGIEREVTK
jgi:hypothetical protein